MDSLPSPTETAAITEKTTRRPIGKWVYTILLMYVLVAGAFMRLIGSNWGDYSYLHPDERFLLMVGTDIQTIDTPADRLGTPPSADGSGRDAWRNNFPQDFKDCAQWGGYFDTSCSPLNPHNMGHSFYVYGTLPMFVTRYVVQAIYGHSGLNEMQDVGRVLSAIMDILTIWLVFLIADRIYNKRVALLAAVFYAFMVLPIQQSHFFTTDTFINFFALLAVYCAIRVQTTLSRGMPVMPVAPEVAEKEPISGDETTLPSDTTPEGGPPPDLRKHPWVQALLPLIRHPLFEMSIAFGVALGCAVASKINAAPVAVLLPLAFLVWMLSQPREARSMIAKQATFYVAVAAVVSILVFRIAQPYAFMGPGFFGFKPNPAWVSNIVEQRIQADGDADLPFALQWARRPLWFSAENLVIYGLGIPLSILAWAGFLWVGWRTVRGLRKNGEAGQHIVLWSWTAFYFAWQCLQFNPMMRYQLPVYPTLAIFAAWGVITLFDLGSKWIKEHQSETEGRSRWVMNGWAARILSISAGTVVLAAVVAYAYGFVHNVYIEPTTRVAASRWIYQNVPGPINVRIQLPGGDIYNEPLPFSTGMSVVPGTAYRTIFTARQDGVLSEILLYRVVTENPSGEAGSLMATISPEEGGEPVLSAAAQGESRADLRGRSYTFKFEQPLPIVKDKNYTLTITVPAEGQPILISGAVPIHEGDWDDPLPYPIDGYNGFGGIYPGDVGLNMYWDDNPEKVTRFVELLTRGDYITISSNRQWGSLPRIPERFPMVTTYYRNLLGCPEDKTVFWCYAVAEPGMFNGNLGFDLIQVFQSDPTIGPFSLNTQFAEESFTVYDAPKVMIFKKNANFDPNHLAAILGAVDFNKVVHLTPKSAGKYNSNPLDLMLPANRLAEQIAGGDWSELFDTDSLVNKYQPLTLLIWYLAVFVLGLIVYPWVRLALAGLPDRGYPLARTAGLLLFSWLAWIGGSFRIPVTRPMLTVVFLLLLLVGAALAYGQRDALGAEWRARKKYFLSIEGLFLLFFLFDLLIRLGNPDLWHPSHGGEKPMDFAYFNAVLKSTTFPPYDPWFSGGYLNYYYYGFVFVGMLVKWLGIVPAVAYNLILPTLFSLIAMGAFSAAWNLAAMRQAKQREKGAGEQGIGDLTSQRFDEPAIQQDSEQITPQEICCDEGAVLPGEEIAAGSWAAAPAVEAASDGVDAPDEDQSAQNEGWPWLAGLAGALGMAVLGNLGTVGMIVNGWQRLMAAPEVIEKADLLSQIMWAFQGALKAFGGAEAPFYVGDWYWIPSRIIPAPGDTQPITEFPFFTFLYADPHAHMYAMAVALLAVAFIIAVVGWRVSESANQRVSESAVWRVGKVAGQWLLMLFLGALAVGALRPVNTWDFPGYLVIGAVVVGYVLLRYFNEGDDLPFVNFIPLWLQRIAAAALAIGIFVGLAFALFQPYADWYALGYTKVDIWKGTHTPLSAYLSHWGLFLFVIVSWILRETRDWMAATPLSSLRKLEPYRGMIVLGFSTLAAAALILMVFFQASIAWFVILWIAWAGVLILRPGMPDSKRLVLFLFGTGLAMTLMVEVIVISGDIGRMNMVFKFYLQAWTLFAACAGASLGFLWPTLKAWGAILRRFWLVIFTSLVISAALFTFTAGHAKIQNRWNIDPGLQGFALAYWLIILTTPLMVMLVLAWLRRREWLHREDVTSKVVYGTLAVMVGVLLSVAGWNVVTDLLKPKSGHTLDGMDYMRYITAYDNPSGNNQPGALLDLTQDYAAIRWVQENIQGSPVIVELAPGGMQYYWYSRFSIYTGLPTVVGWQWHQEQQRQSPLVAQRGQEVRAFYQAVDPAEARSFLQKYSVRYIIVGQAERGFYPGPGLNKFDVLNGILWKEVYRAGEMVIYEVIDGQ